MGHEIHCRVNPRTSNWSNGSCQEFCFCFLVFTKFFWQLCGFHGEASKFFPGPICASPNAGDLNSGQLGKSERSSMALSEKRVKDGKRLNPKSIGSSSFWQSKSIFLGVNRIFCHTHMVLVMSCGLTTAFPLSIWRSIYPTKVSATCLAKHSPDVVGCRTGSNQSLGSANSNSSPT